MRADSPATGVGERSLVRLANDGIVEPIKGHGGSDNGGGSGGGGGGDGENTTGDGAGRKQRWRVGVLRSS